MLYKFAAVICCVAALASVPAFAQETREISFGILSTESSQNLKNDWQPLLADMEKRTGLKVNAFFAPHYAGVIEAMRFNKMQVAWLGNKSGIEAVDRANAEVFAQVVNADGSIGYDSMVSVHKDSPYKTIVEVLQNGKSLSFGMGDPNSTSGFLVPSYYIFAQNNLDPKTTFKNVRGANHEVNIMAVANKQGDAAVHSSDVLERIENKLTLSGFRDSSNAQLMPTRQLELFKEKTRLEADAGMNAQDKTTKLDAINKKLAELQRAS